MEDTVIGVPNDIFNKIIENEVSIGTNAIGTNAIGTNAIGTNAIGTGTIESQFTSLLLELSNIQAKVRLLEKTVLKKAKVETKIQHPSGFDLPTPITDDLCAFMNKPAGSTSTRPIVTNYILNYIRQNKLQDLIDRKKIKTDERLRHLLRLNSTDEEITYFNLQKYLQVHFI